MRVPLYLRRVFMILMVLVVLSGVASAESPLKLRGTAGPMPFWLGSSLYNNNWKGFEQNDHSTNWWWFDTNYWCKTFEQYQAAGLNSIVYWHPHPFVGFIKLDKYPEARLLSDEETQRQIKMFRWITSEGKKYGVSIYLLIWNICLPPGMQKAHGLNEFGEDTALTRSYTRYVVDEMYRTYPDLGGLITMAAENPPGCTDFVKSAIVTGLRDSVTNSSPRKALPEFVFWTWCSYPEAAKSILDSYPGPKMALHYLQYENFFRPTADPRIKMTSDSLGGLKVVTMGGPMGVPFFGDPFFIQTMMQDLVKKNGGGIFFQGTDYLAGYAERWVAREAFERYSLNPYQKDGADYWQGRIAARYGNPQIAKPLLRAMIDSSNVMPRFMHLVHSQTDHYMPQLGMLLVNILEMPTISSYVFENHESVDAKGRLTPNMGLTWPNPSWGEEVLSIKQYVAGVRQIKGRKATTPVEIADEMERLCRSSMKALQTAKPLVGLSTLRKQELPNSMLLMEFNCLMGLHYAERIRTGLAWQAWKLGKPSSTTASVLKHLDASNEWWRRMSVLAESAFPGPTGGWQSRISVEPPWNHNEVWQGYTNISMRPSEMLPYFRRERAIVASELTKPRNIARLPLFPELDLPDGVYETVAKYDFEGAWPDQLEINPSKDAVTKLTSAPDRVIGKGRSLYCDSRVGKQEWNLFLSGRPEKLRLIPGEKYVVDFDYRVISKGKQSMPFAVAARTVLGGWQKDVGNYRQWRGAAGQVGHKTVTIEPTEFNDYHLFFSIHGQAAVSIDNIRIRLVVR